MAVRQEGLRKRIVLDSVEQVVKLPPVQTVKRALVREALAPRPAAGFATRRSSGGRPRTLETTARMTLRVSAASPFTSSERAKPRRCARRILPRGIAPIGSGATWTRITDSYRATERGARSARRDCTCRRRYSTNGSLVRVDCLAALETAEDRDERPSSASPSSVSPRTTSDDDGLRRPGLHQQRHNICCRACERTSHDSSSFSGSSPAIPRSLDPATCSRDAHVV